jgi:hypothetical protein
LIDRSIANSLTREQHIDRVRALILLSWPHRRGE